MGLEADGTEAQGLGTRSVARAKGAVVGAYKRTRSFQFGFTCTMRGFARMARTPSWWPYAVVPVLLALAVFVALLAWMIYEGVIWAAELAAPYTGDVGRWAAVIITFLALLVVGGIAFWVMFPAFSRLVGAPFLALFSDKVVARVSGVPTPTLPYPRFVRWVLIPLWEAFVLLLVRVAIIILAFPLNIIPVLGQAAFFGVLLPVGALDLLDLAMSARGVPMGKRIPFVWRNLSACAGLGAGAAVWILIPLVNVFVMPALVVGAVLLDQELSPDFPAPPEPSEPDEPDEPDEPAPPEAS